MSENNISNIQKKISIFSICLLLFIDSVGTGLIFPILPSLFTNSENGLIAAGSIHYRNFLYGLSFAAFPIASLFGMPILGSMSDIYGRKKTIILGMSIVVCSYFFSVVSVIYHSALIFLFSRALTGFGSGTFPIGNAVLIDISKNENEKITNLKFATASTVLGFILGPSFSILMPKLETNYTLSMPFIITLILGIINLIIIM